MYEFGNVVFRNRDKVAGVVHKGNVNQVCVYWADAPDGRWAWVPNESVTHVATLIPEEEKKKEVKRVPLMVAGQVVGMIIFDFESDPVIFSGRMLDSEFAKILAEGIGENLLEVSFMGIPANPVKSQAELSEWLDRVGRKKND